MIITGYCLDGLVDSPRWLPCYETLFSHDFFLETDT
jgi:hypothetical protein